MILLVEYNQRTGTLVSEREFDDSMRHEAAIARLELELDLNRRCAPHEVVLLEAESREALLRTHSRYFRTMQEMTKSAVEMLKRVIDGPELTNQSGPSDPTSSG